MKILFESATGRKREWDSIPGVDEILSLQVLGSPDGDYVDGVFEIYLDGKDPEYDDGIIIEYPTVPTPEGVEGDSYWTEEYRSYFAEEIIDILTYEIEEGKVSPVKTAREQIEMTQKEFSALLKIPISTLQDWEQNRRTPPDYVVEMIKERVKKLNRKMEVRMGIYTSLTGTKYDVHDFMEVLENLLGDLPTITNERQFYSSIQKLAQSKGYSIGWISKSLTNDVILDTLVDKPHYAVVGFGVEKSENKDKLMAELKLAKSELEKTTDKDIQQAVFKYYQEKAEKYKL